MKEKLSVFLNRNFYYEKLIKFDTNYLSELAIEWIDGMKTLIYKNPAVALNEIKNEALKVKNKLDAIEEDIKSLNSQMQKIIKNKKYLSELELKNIDELERKKEITIEYYYSGLDGLSYFFEVLSSCYTIAEIKFEFISKFENALPRNNYLKHLLSDKTGSLWILNQELLHFTRVVDKYDFWIEKYYSTFKENVKFISRDGDVNDTRQSIYDKSTFTEVVCSYFNVSATCSSAYIPEVIYKLHFSSEINNPRLAYEFLSLSGKQWAYEYYIPKVLAIKNNPIELELLEKELKPIVDKEIKAKEFLREGKIHLEESKQGSGFNELVEIKRIQSNYYLVNSHRFPFTKGGESTADVIARYVHLKKYLLERIDELKPSEKQINLFDYKDISLVIETMCKGIKSLSRRPRNFSNEDSYRSHFYYIFDSISEFSVTAEAESRDGRTDLLLIGKDGEQIIEFKIWGRNDYKEVGTQIIKYLSDFDSAGYIFMVNESKDKLINEDYFQFLESEIGLLSDIVEVQWREFNYYYFISKHEHKERYKTLYHFLYNVNQ